MSKNETAAQHALPTAGGFLSSFSINICAAIMASQIPALLSRLAGSGLTLAKPDSSLFTFPPKSDPRVLPAPQPGSSTAAPPFSIPNDLYAAALDARIPITIATVYAVTVTLVNAYNRRRGNKPWAISKTRGFFWFVVAHNVFLAVYSAWTFIGMWRALSVAVANPFTGPDGFVGTVDSLCKIHGASGLGNATTYDPVGMKWVSENPAAVVLNSSHEPSRADVGRMWNQGMAFYGWFFYLSKFYEVLDTVIILAKGKRSSTLQTYHHAGAMMCMWAGIRFMSPPIWMFCLVNSFIHALMYTYYTITAFSIRVPNRIKRSLTTMQITQFLVGVAYASLHSFITYRVPVQIYNSPIAHITSAVESMATEAAASGVGALAKKILLRAADQEGLAEKIEVISSTAISAAAAASASAAQERAADPHAAPGGYHTEYVQKSCLDTSGQTFAVWLNVFYLTPLTFLFVRFFVKSYLRRGAQANKKGGKIEKSGKDALKGVRRELDESVTPTTAEESSEDGVLREKTNGQGNGSAKSSGKAKKGGKKANGSAASGGVTLKDPTLEGGNAVLKTGADANKNVKAVAVKDPVLKGGDAIMKTS